VYPYTRGNNNLRSIVPPWAHEGGTFRMLARLKDPADRGKMKHDIENGIDGWYNHYTAVGRDWSRMLVSGNNPFKGRTMDKIMDDWTPSNPGPMVRRTRLGEKGISFQLDPLQPRADGEADAAGRKRNLLSVTASRFRARASTPTSRGRSRKKTTPR
jgi:hypothetical protein